MSEPVMFGLAVGIIVFCTLMAIFIAVITYRDLWRK